MQDLLKPGVAIVLHERFSSDGSICIILEVRRSDFPGNSGWISFDYQVMTSSGKIINISESCVKKVLN